MGTGCSPRQTSFPRESQSTAPRYPPGDRVAASADPLCLVRGPARLTCSAEGHWGVVLEAERCPPPPCHPPGCPPLCPAVCLSRPRSGSQPRVCACRVSRGNTARPPPPAEGRSSCRVPPAAASPPEPVRPQLPGAPRTQDGQYPQPRADGPVPYLGEGPLLPRGQRGGWRLWGSIPTGGKGQPAGCARSEGRSPAGTRGTRAGPSTGRAIRTAGRRGTRAGWDHPLPQRPWRPAEPAAWCLQGRGQFLRTAERSGQRGAVQG